MQREPLRKAIEWLEKRQDQEYKYWDASSMNKRYPVGSMQERFMREAATGFAALALAAAEPERGKRIR
jgi:hypothetical protein